MLSSSFSSEIALALPISGAFLRNHGARAACKRRWCLFVALALAISIGSAFAVQPPIVLPQGGVLQTNDTQSIVAGDILAAGKRREIGAARLSVTAVGFSPGQHIVRRVYLFLWILTWRLLRSYAPRH